jgi:hypothetical protein
MKTEKHIADIDIIDHGVEHPDYFQGCGVSFSKFTHVVTGIGSSLFEAIEDCLEQIAMAGHDIGAIQNEFSKKITVKKKSECYHHASIRYNLEGDQND